MGENERHIILGVTGGIAAYKAADLCSKLRQAGVSVRVAFSNSAHHFVTPLVFETLSGNPVYRQVFDTPTSYQMEHITWSKWADTLVIAPASADTISRLVTGQANDAITTLYLAFRGAVYLAPSMNTAMLEHPATQANLSTLAERGVTIIAPAAGSLACGDTGAGRMAEPSQIMASLGLEKWEATEVSIGHDHQANLRAPDKSLADKTVLITSGPTREYLDPVRYISNPSSGRMGLALANEAMRRGANVVFVSGPVDPHFLPLGNSVIYPVETAREMLSKVEELRAASDMFIFAAAVGDFRPAQPLNRKMKRSGNSITLPLIENPDIAQAMGFAKRPDQISIGFAAETNDLDVNARLKLERKNMDAIVINDVSNPGIGFNSPENEVRITLANGNSIDVSQRVKSEVAYEIMETAVTLLRNVQQ